MSVTIKYKKNITIETWVGLMHLADTVKSVDTKNLQRYKNMGQVSYESRVKPSLC